MLKKINALVLLSLMVSACSNPSVTPNEPATGGDPLPTGTVLIDPKNPDHPPTPAPISSNVSSGSSSSFYSSAGVHTVQRGETLFSLARRYNVSVNELMAWNHLSSPSALKVGQKLRVKGGRSGSTTSRAVTKPKKAQKTSTISSNYHVVKRGETLFSIAKRYHQSIGNIAKWNGLRKSARVKVGQRLRVRP